MLGSGSLRRQDGRSEPDRALPLVPKTRKEGERRSPSPRRSSWAQGSSPAAVSHPDGFSGEQSWFTSCPSGSSCPGVGSPAGSWLDSPSLELSLAAALVDLLAVVTAKAVSPEVPVSGVV